MARMLKTLSFVLLVAISASSCDRGRGTAAADDRVDADYRRAMTYYQAGNLDLAIKALEKCITANPLNASARFQLACLNEEARKDYLGAILDYREFLRLVPDGEKAKLARSRLARCTEIFLQNKDGALLRGEAEEKNDAVLLLKAENKRLVKVLGETRRELSLLKEENARIKKTLLSTGSPEEEDSAPPKIALNDKDLLEESDAAPSIAQKAAQDLVHVDPAEESEAPPLQAAASPSSAQRPSESVKEKSQATPPAQARPRVYTVEEGETLTSIARRFYGNGAHWRKIQQANRAVISVDGKVNAGMEITLP